MVLNLDQDDRISRGYGWLRKESRLKLTPPVSNMAGEELYEEVLKIKEICKQTSLPSQLARYVSNFGKMSYYDYELCCSNEKILRTLGASPKGADSPNIKTIEDILAGSKYNLDRKQLDEIIIALDKGLNEENFGFSRVAFEPIREDMWGYLDISNIKWKGKPLEVFGVELIEVPVTKEVWEQNYNQHGTKALTRLYHEGNIGLSSDVRRGKPKNGSMPANYYLLQNQPFVAKYMS